MIKKPKLHISFDFMILFHSTQTKTKKVQKDDNPCEELKATGETQVIPPELVLKIVEIDHALSPHEAALHKH